MTLYRPKNNNFIGNIIISIRKTFNKFSFWNGAHDFQWRWYLEKAGSCSKVEEVCFETTRTLFSMFYVFGIEYIDVTSIYLKEQKFLAESLMGISYAAIVWTYIHSYTNQRETKHRHEIWNFYFAHFLCNILSFSMYIFDSKDENQLSGHDVNNVFSYFIFDVTWLIIIIL